MPLTTCKICLTEHFDELPCPNCETSIDLSEVEEAKPIGFISDETRQWLLDENGRGPGMFTPNRNGAGGVWAIYGGWEYKRLLTIAKNLQKQCVLMHGVVAAARTLYEETEEYDFPDGMGKGALQEYWDALADALEPELDAAIKAAQPSRHTSLDIVADRTAIAQLPREQPERVSVQVSDDRKLWLWKNFVDGRPEYWAFDNPYPIHLHSDDPQTLGEPIGYAIFKESRACRADISDAEVLSRIKKAAAQEGK